MSRTGLRQALRGDIPKVDNSYAIFNIATLTCLIDLAANFHKYAQGRVDKSADSLHDYFNMSNSHSLKNMHLFRPDGATVHRYKNAVEVNTSHQKALIS